MSNILTRFETSNMFYMHKDNEQCGFLVIIDGVCYIKLEDNYLRPFLPIYWIYVGELWVC